MTGRMAQDTQPGAPMTSLCPHRARVPSSKICGGRCQLVRAEISRPGRPPRTDQGSDPRDERQRAGLPARRSLLDAVLVLDLLENLGVLDVPRRRPLLEVLDPVADFLVDRLVELHVLLADVLD